MAFIVSRFPAPLPYTSATFRPGRRISPCCDCLPAACLPGAPGAGADLTEWRGLPPSWDSRFLMAATRQRAAGPPAAHRRRWRAPRHLRPAPSAAMVGGCSISPWTARAGLISQLQRAGDGGAGTRSPGLQRTPSSTGNCCFASSPRWPAAPLRLPSGCWTEDGYLFITLGDRYTERAQAEPSATIS